MGDAVSGTIMLNFTPIGATVDEISVTGHRKKTANLVTCHTNEWRVIMSLFDTGAARRDRTDRRAAHVVLAAISWCTF